MNKQAVILLDALKKAMEEWREVTIAKDDLESIMESLLD